jgi:hypothetical protein
MRSNRPTRYSVPTAEPNRAVLPSTLHRPNAIDVNPDPRAEPPGRGFVTSRAKTLLLRPDETGHARPDSVRVGWIASALRHASTISHFGLVRSHLRKRVHLDDDDEAEVVQRADHLARLPPRLTPASPSTLFASAGVPSVSAGNPPGSTHTGGHGAGGQVTFAAQPNGAAKALPRRRPPRGRKSAAPHRTALRG